MKIISAGAHGALDYITVVIFLIAPTLFGLDGGAAMLAYALAAVHLLLTLITAFAPGLVEVVPFTFHGWVELAVSIALVLLGLFAFEADGSTFYVAIAIAIFVVWLTTEYEVPGDV